MDDFLLNSQMVSELVEGVLRVCGDNVRQIILYGSVARHEETDESDIDIALILKQELSGEIRTKFIKWASELDLKYDRIFSIIDIEQERMNKWKNVLPFYKNICEEGVVLWTAA